MSKQDQHKQSSAADEAAPDDTRAGSNALWPLCILSLLVALAAAAVSGWLWWDRQTLEQQLTQLEGQTLSQAQFRDHHQAVESRLAALEVDWQDARRVLEELRPLARDGRGAWLRAEVLWLLRMAERNLALGGDPELSMEALRQADERLRGLGDPELLPVREALAEEMAELEAVAWADIDGMVLRLAKLAQQTQEWPLQRSEHPQSRLGLHGTGPESEPEAEGAEDAPPWQRMMDNLTEVARGLVVVRRHDETLSPLLPPEQAYFKRLNAALQLDALRVALLRQDAPLFSAQLTLTGDWIARYFDTDDEAVAAALLSLRQWQETDIDPPRPELGQALRRLQRIHAGGTAEADS